MQIENAVKLLLLGEESDSLTGIVIKSLSENDPIETLKPELQTKGHRARIISILKIIDEIKITSFLNPINERLLEILDTSEILAMEKARKNFQDELLEARKKVKDLEVRIEQM